MAAKIFFIFCASTVVIQTISAQCIGSALAAEELALAGNAYAPNMAYRASMAPYGGVAPGCGFNFAPSSGGGFPIISTSPIAPTGITVVSENAIEGALSVIGELPFLGAVALEGALPTAGAGGINYGCGDGAIGIVSEGIAPAYGPMGPAGMAPGRFGLGAGLAAPGFGAGLGAPGFGAAGFAAPGFGAAGLAAPGCAAGMPGPGFALSPYGAMY